ncbi:MAG: NUDIX domain-containing protein [Bacteroidales bacterium]|nr:NUDIX domain-containing protein [Bacteroidales bacterium]
MDSVNTRIFLPGTIVGSKLTYVVIGAQYRGDWIFVRHQDRVTWEMPAGHIENDESAGQAAVRELFEEAGVVNSSLVHICDYMVSIHQKIEYGRLYGAIVNELDPILEHEIVELYFSDELPSELTYPEVQTLLFARVKQHFQL